MQDNFNIHGWRLKQSLNETEKIKGKDGKGCWKGYRYAGTENGKDKCIPVKEEKQLCKECGAVYMEEGQCMECGYLEEATFTGKYNDDPKLKGGQKDLPDEIQSKIVAKEGEDHEVSMAQSSLKSIVGAASELISKIGDEEFDIPGWIQDHITNAENYISQANKGYHKLKPSLNTSELQEGISETDKAEQALYTYLKGEVKGLNYPKIKSYVLDIKQASRQEGYDECRDDNAY